MGIRIFDNFYSADVLTRKETVSIAREKIHLNKLSINWLENAQNIDIIKNNKTTSSTFKIFPLMSISRPTTFDEFRTTNGRPLTVVLWSSVFERPVNVRFTYMKVWINFGRCPIYVHGYWTNFGWMSANSRSMDDRFWTSTGCSIYIRGRLKQFWTENGTSNFTKKN